MSKILINGSMFQTDHMPVTSNSALKAEDFRGALERTVTRGVGLPPQREGERPCSLAVLGEL